MRKIRRCKHCKDVIKSRPNEDKTIHTVAYKRSYCSNWCYEMENPPRVDRVCLVCNVAVKRSPGTSYYPKRCKSCRKILGNGIGRLSKEQIKKAKELHDYYLENPEKALLKGLKCKNKLGKNNEKTKNKQSKT